VISSSSRRAGRPEASSACFTIETRLGILELHRREVDGNADIPRPAGRIDASLAQHPIAEKVSIIWTDPCGPLKVREFAS
jgi:hypothetical protein